MSSKGTYMLLDRLDTFDFVAETSAILNPAANTKVRTGSYFAAAVIAIAGYIALAAWILSTNTDRVYGFAISHDPRTAIEIALQICPMLAAIFLVFLSPLSDQLARYLAVCTESSPVIMTAAVSATAAAITVLATASAIIGVCGFHSPLPAMVTLLWVAGELMFDVTLIGVFAAALYSLTRKLWLTILLFIAYVGLVTVVGPRWEITSYVGFGSTVPVMLTTYSTAPLYDGAGWLLRGYWTCVTFLLLSVLYTLGFAPQPLFSVDWMPRLRGRAPLGVTAALLALCILIGSQLFRLQRYAYTRGRALATAVLNTELQAETSRTRLQLKHFDVRLTYSPGEQIVAVHGNLTLTTGSEAIRTAWFELPALMTSEILQFAGAGPYLVQPLGKYIRVTFRDGIPPGKEIDARYSGMIRPASAFDLPAQAKILDSAFFLTDADVLITARRAACITPGLKDCARDENYLMSDQATGNITVIAPEQFTVATVGEESVRKLADGAFERTFSIPAPRLATFMIACAPFHKSSAVAKNGVRIQVFRSSRVTLDKDTEAPLAKAILDFYQDFWPSYSRANLNVVETPAPIGEALSYDGVLAISDKIINSRSPFSAGPSSLLEFVMAHEIAHQWWGYRVVPTRAPGRMFLTESIAQFAAYKFLSIRGILSEQDAIQNEGRRYQKARRNSRGRESALAESQTGDELVYNKGPFALLSLDRLSGGLLMNGLGSLVNTYSGSHGNTKPDRFIASLMKVLPEQSRGTAHNLIYEVGHGK